MENALYEQVKDKLNRFKYLNAIIRDDMKKFQKNHPTHFNLIPRHLGSETSLSEKEYEEFLELEELLQGIHDEIDQEINR